MQCEGTDFKTNKILERKDIEKWIENYPAILGEELLVVTTEFDRFDEPDERLDILALDTDGNLVIVELNRDDSGKNVDLQAIKYAAYCSTMGLDEVTQLFKAYSKRRGSELTDEQARERLVGFIENEDFEDIGDRPRVILVARQLGK